MYGTLIYFVLGILYFAIVGRHRLVLSPEEEFALTEGEKGVPEAEGFSTSSAEQEAILRGESGSEVRDLQDRSRDRRDLHHRSREGAEGSEHRARRPTGRRAR